MSLPPAMHDRSLTEPVHRKPPRLEDPGNMDASSSSDRPLLTGHSQKSSPGGDLSEDTRYGAAFDETVIPPSHPFRTLVVCYDGTGDQFDDDVRLLDILSVSCRSLAIVRIRTLYSFSPC